MDRSEAKIEKCRGGGLRAVVQKRGRNSAWPRRRCSKASYRTALDQHLIDIVAADETGWWRLDGREITRFDGRHETLHLRGRRSSLRAQLAGSRCPSPNVALLLLILGVLGVHIEFTHPVTGVAGGILAF
jgi:membrane-bound ClpP family serine protease